MRSKSDVQGGTPSQSPVALGSDATDQVMAKKTSIKSRLLFRPSLKSRISNPELRSDFKQSSFYDGMERLSMYQSTADYSTYSQRESLIERTDSSTPRCISTEVTPMQCTIARPRLSPMEYARINLIDVAMSTRQNVSARFPKLTKEWYWTPKWEKFLIIPRMPSSRDSLDYTTVSSVYPLEAEEFEAGGALLPSSGTSALGISSLATKSRATSACPRLSLNLGGMSAMFPSMMNLASYGQTLLRHQTSTRINDHLQQGCKRDLISEQNFSLRMVPPVSPHEAQAHMSSAMEEQRLSCQDVRHSATLEPGHNIPGHNISYSCSASVDSTVREGVLAGDSNTAQLQKTPQKTRTETLIQSSYSLNPILPGNLSPVGQFPIAPNSSRLAPSAVARQIIRRAGGQLHNQGEPQRTGTLVRVNSMISIQASSEDFALSDSSDGESDLQPAPLRLGQQCQRQDTAPDHNPTTPVDRLHDGFRDDAGFQNHDSSRVSYGTSPESYMPTRQRQLSVVATPSPHPRNPDSTASTSYGQPRFSRHYRRLGMMYKAVPDSPTLPASEALILLPGDSPNVPSPSPCMARGQSESVLDSSSIPPHDMDDTSQPRSVGSRTKQFLFPLTPKKIRKGSRKVNDGSSISLHKAKSNETFTVLPKFGQRRQPQHKTGHELSFIANSSEAGSSNKFSFLTLPKRTSSRDSQITPTVRHVPAQDSLERRKPAGFGDSFSSNRKSAYGSFNSPHSPLENFHSLYKTVFPKDTPSPVNEREPIATTNATRGTANVRNHTVPEQSTWRETKNKIQKSRHA